MRCWIKKKDQGSYEYLMRSNNSEPSIIEENDDELHVDMTASVAQSWNMMGYWYRIG
jgi:hypothetical protein